MHTFLRYNYLKVKKKQNRFNGFRKYIMYTDVYTIQYNRLGQRGPPCRRDTLYNKINPPMCFSDKLNWGGLCQILFVIRSYVSGCPGDIDCVYLDVDLFICWVPYTRAIILLLYLIVFCPFDFIDKSLGEMMI